MKTARWQLLLGLSLVLLSGTVYLVHYGIFGDAHHIFIYLVGDIAFVPIEVLLVTLIIHRLLSEREKQGMLRKMNMVIGAFFSEVGTGLLERFQRMDADSGGLGRRLETMSEWTRRQFRSASAGLAGRQRQIDAHPEDLQELRSYLAERRGFLLALLGNPNLLEHESFTNLLWAVFHLTEELVHRGGLEDLPETDRRHLCGDINRAYNRLIREWLAYMRHLQAAYPYLFSLASRTNPFDPQASAVVA